MEAATAMDFHTLSRRELQALCKRNGVRANMTNAAMAEALKDLDSVDGIDEIGSTLCLPTPGKSAMKSAAKLVAVEEQQHGSPLPRGRRVSVKSPEAIRMELEGGENDTKEIVKTPGVALRSTRRGTRATPAPLPTPVPACSTRTTARRNAARKTGEVAPTPATRRDQRTASRKAAAAVEADIPAEDLPEEKTSKMAIALDQEFEVVADASKEKVQQGEPKAAVSDAKCDDPKEEKGQQEEPKAVASDVKCDDPEEEEEIVLEGDNKEEELEEGEEADSTDATTASAAVLVQSCNDPKVEEVAGVMEEQSTESHEGNVKELEPISVERYALLTVMDDSPILGDIEKEQDASVEDCEDSAEFAPAWEMTDEIIPITEDKEVAISEEATGDKEVTINEEVAINEEAVKEDGLANTVETDPTPEEILTAEGEETIEEGQVILTEGKGATDEIPQAGEIGEEGEEDYLTELKQGGADKVLQAELADNETSEEDEDVSEEGEGAAAKMLQGKLTDDETSEEEDLDEDEIVLEGDNKEEELEEGEEADSSDATTSSAAVLVQSCNDPKVEEVVGVMEEQSTESHEGNVKELEPISVERYALLTVMDDSPILGDIEKEQDASVEDCEDSAEFAPACEMTDEIIPITEDKEVAISEEATGDKEVTINEEVAINEEAVKEDGLANTVETDPTPEEILTAEGEETIEEGQVILTEGKGATDVIPQAGEIGDEGEEDYLTELKQGGADKVLQAELADNETSEEDEDVSEEGEGAAAKMLQGKLTDDEASEEEDLDEDEEIVLEGDNKEEELEEGEEADSSDATTASAAVLVQSCNDPKVEEVAGVMEEQSTESHEGNVKELEPISVERYALLTVMDDSPILGDIEKEQDASVEDCEDSAEFAPAWEMTDEIIPITEDKEVAISEEATGDKEVTINEEVAINEEAVKEDGLANTVETDPTPKEILTAEGEETIEEGQVILTEGKGATDEIPQAGEIGEEGEEDYLTELKQGGADKVLQAELADNETSEEDEDVSEEGEGAAAKMLQGKLTDDETSEEEDLDEDEEWTSDDDETTEEISSSDESDEDTDQTIEEDEVILPEGKEGSADEMPQSGETSEKDYLTELKQGAAEEWASDDDENTEEIGSTDESDEDTDETNEESYTTAAVQMLQGTGLTEEANEDASAEDDDFSGDLPPEFDNVTVSDAETESDIAAPVLEENQAAFASATKTAKSLDDSAMSLEQEGPEEADATEKELKEVANIVKALDEFTFKEGESEEMQKQQPLDYNSMSLRKLKSTYKKCLAAKQEGKQEEVTEGKRLPLEEVDENACINH